MYMSTKVIYFRKGRKTVFFFKEVMDHLKAGLSVRAGNILI